MVATLEMALAILLEAALSFLGLGVPPPLPSWGLMIAEGKDYMFFTPWVILIPGVALFALVLGINLLGEQTTLEGKRAVTLPLRFNDGAVYLGPIPIGSTPALF